MKGIMYLIVIKLICKNYILLTYHGKLFFIKLWNIKFVNIFNLMSNFAKYSFVIIILRKDVSDIFVRLNKL